jgi:hypothetical protein
VAVEDKTTGTFVGQCGLRRSMREQGLVDYYGMEGPKKYVAAREWWRSPLAS